jgi:nitrous oxidase accessory protein NosD
MRLLLAFSCASLAQAAVLTVAPPGTLQGAVDAASPGDRIRIGPGTYVEQVIVTKDLTLDADPGATLRAPAGPLQTFADEGTPQAGILTVMGADVTVRGLTIDGNLAATPDYELAGVSFANAGGGVIGCHIENVAAPGWPLLRDDLFGAGIYSVNTGSPRTLVVTDNVIDHFNNFGINAIGTGEDFAPIVTVATVERNVVRGAGPQPLVGQFGILVFRGATGTIKGNYIDEMGTPNFDSEGGVGIHARFADGVVIDNNELIHVQTGIRCHDTKTAHVVGNHYVGNPAGTDYGGLAILCGGDGPRLIANNVIENLVYGSDPNDFRVGIVGFGTQSQIVGNRVELGPSGAEGVNGPNAIVYFGDDGRIDGNKVTMPLWAPSVGDIHVEPIIVLALGDRNAITGNDIIGQASQPLLYGVAFAGADARVTGNRFTDLPVGILQLQNQDGLTTTNAKIDGNSFRDVGVPLQVQ